MSGKITKVSGPLVVAEGLADANVSDVVRVGDSRLIGEILNMTGDRASIQVYEETSGLGPGAAVVTTGMPMSVELGPGMLDNIYDGIQRPLPEMRALTGDSITRGTDVPALNREKKWDFVPTAAVGDKLSAGDVIGTVQETSAILHRIMVPPKMSGTLKSVQGGSFTVTDTVAVLTDEKGVDHELSLRLGQDGGPAPAGQVVRRGHRHLHRLRRARQRDDRRPDGVPRTQGPAQRRAADEADRADRQHLGYARGGA